MKTGSNSNISGLKLGEFTGSPSEYLAWVTSMDANMSGHPYTVWGLANETPSYYYSPEDLKRIVSIALTIRHYYAPMLIALGIMGNLLAILTISMTKLTKLPAMHFFMGITSIDLCFLVSLFLWWIGSFSVRLTTFPGWCQSVTFISSLTSFTSVWLHCALSIERYICSTSKRHSACVALFYDCFSITLKRCRLSEPSCSSIVCTTLKVKACIMAIFVIGVTVYVNTSLAVDYVFIGNIAICVPMYHFVPYLSVLNKLDVFFNVLIPYSLILLFNARTICVFKSNYHNKNRMISRHCIDRASLFLRNKADIHLTVASFVLCMVFLCLQSPSQVLRAVYLSKETADDRSLVTLQEYLLQQFLHAAYYTKFAINLPVLVISHKGFRTALKLLLWRMQLKIKSIFHKEQTALAANTVRFTVEFSCTLMRLHETSLI